MLKKKIEALLFSSGRKMSVEEVAGLCHKSATEVVQALNELKEKFSEDSSLMLVEEGNFWKLTPREDYLHLVRQIVTKTELSKTLMETLAIIAFKYPLKQSDLIKMRTNKAYDHLRELEEMGYITRQKYGRTKLIKLTQKFFEYFSLKEDHLKDQFKDFDSIAHKIEEKEGQIKNIREEQKKKAKEAGKKDKEIEEAVDKLGEVDLVDGKGHKVKLDIVDEPKIVEGKELKKLVKGGKGKLGDLDVVDTTESEETDEGEFTESAEKEDTISEGSDFSAGQAEPTEEPKVQLMGDESETAQTDPEVQERIEEIKT
ncbi:MAG: SMC-Scp complex subunit ScpB, partial [Promethearchaeota archaeon]